MHVLSNWCSKLTTKHDPLTVTPYIPFSGRNPNLSALLSGRPKVLVLNKMDQADSSIASVSGWHVRAGKGWGILDLGIFYLFHCICYVNHVMSIIEGLTYSECSVDVGLCARMWALFVCHVRPPPPPPPLPPLSQGEVGIGGDLMCEFHLALLGHYYCYINRGEAGFVAVDLTTGCSNQHLQIPNAEQPIWSS